MTPNPQGSASAASLESSVRPLCSYVNSDGAGKGRPAQDEARYGKKLEEPRLAAWMHALPLKEGQKDVVRKVDQAGIREMVPPSVAYVREPLCIEDQ